MIPPEPLSQIDVLLATYNGARFLRDQIESIYAQDHVRVRIIARDDGSSDDTVAILQQYAAARPESFRLLEDGVRTGCARDNFGRLMQVTDADYVAFADQDDIWLPNKLQITMQRMRQLEAQYDSGVPLLVHTDLRVVDQHLQTLSESFWESNQIQHVQHATLAKLLAENVVTGCTVVMNRALVGCVRPMPEAWIIHDQWVALIAASLGAVAALPQATMLYRQHDSNETGAVLTPRSFSERVATFLSTEGLLARRQRYAKVRAQARSLLAIHGNAMSAEKRSVVEDFIALETMSRVQRIRTTFRRRMWRDDKRRRLSQLIDLLRSN